MHKVSVVPCCIEPRFLGFKIFLEAVFQLLLVSRIFRFIKSLRSSFFKRKRILINKVFSHKKNNVHFYMGTYAFFHGEYSK